MLFFQEKVAQAWAFSGKILENKCSFFKSLSGGLLAFLKKKYYLPKVMQTGFKPVQQWQISNNIVVRKQNTRSHQHWLLSLQKKRVTENYH